MFWGSKRTAMIPTDTIEAINSMDVDPNPKGNIVLSPTQTSVIGLQGTLRTQTVESRHCLCVFRNILYE